jgi:hypothetical protein
VVGELSRAARVAKNSLFLDWLFYYRLPVTQQQPIETIQQLAEAVMSRGLAVPAVFALELCKPLTGCLRELYGASEVLQEAIFGRQLLPALKELLVSSERVEEFIILLERQGALKAKGA